MSADPAGGRGGASNRKRDLQVDLRTAALDADLRRRALGYISLAFGVIVVASAAFGSVALLLREPRPFQSGPNVGFFFLIWYGFMGIAGVSQLAAGRWILQGRNRGFLLAMVTWAVFPLLGFWSLVPLGDVLGGWPLGFVVSAAAIGAIAFIWSEQGEDRPEGS